MSDMKKSVAQVERRLRFRRRMANEKAVSPVVATLILILIAVAAAAALYLWLVGWQGGVTKSIGSPTVPSDLKFSIGGSTTVYPLSQLAIQWFEQNNTNTNITDQQGGSVAGAEAYCQGQVTVGAASTSFTTAQLAGDGCSGALASATVQTVVAVDGIVGIVSAKNPGIGNGHPTYEVPDANVSFNASTMFALYYAASSGTSSTNTGAFPGEGAPGAYTYPAWLCGAAAPAGWTAQRPASGAGSTAVYQNCPVSQGHPIVWSNIPFPAGCDVTKPTGGTAGGCYWPFANTNNTATYDRQDSSGTEQGFTQKYLLIPKDGASNSCGTDNQLESCNIIATHHEEGNPLLASAVAGDQNAVGFNSYGQAAAQAALSPAVIIAGFQSTITSSNGISNTIQPVPVTPTVTNVLGAYRGTVTGAAAYGAWRVLEYLTDGTPATGSVVANYLNFVLGPEVNLNLATATGYISLYAA